MRKPTEEQVAKMKAQYESLTGKKFEGNTSLYVPLVIQQSVEARGLFVVAEKAIPADTLLVDYTGEKFIPDFLHLPKNTSKYMISFTNDTRVERRVDASEKGNHASLINDGFPNSLLTPKGVKTLVNVAQNEEILHDYGTNHSIKWDPNYALTEQSQLAMQKFGAIFKNNEQTWFNLFSLPINVKKIVKALVCAQLAQLVYIASTPMAMISFVRQQLTEIKKDEQKSYLNKLTGFFKRVLSIDSEFTPKRSIRCQLYYYFIDLFRGMNPSELLDSATEDKAIFCQLISSWGGNSASITLPPDAFSDLVTVNELVFDYFQYVFKQGNCDGGNNVLNQIQDYWNKVKSALPDDFKATLDVRQLDLLLVCYHSLLNHVNSSKEMSVDLLLTLFESLVNLTSEMQSSSKLVLFQFAPRVQYCLNFMVFALRSIFTKQLEKEKKTSGQSTREAGAPQRLFSGTSDKTAMPKPTSTNDVNKSNVFNK